MCFSVFSMTTESLFVETGVVLRLSELLPPSTFDDNGRRPPCPEYIDKVEGMRSGVGLGAVRQLLALTATACLAPLFSLSTADPSLAATLTVLDAAGAVSALVEDTGHAVVVIPNDEVKSSTVACDGLL